MAPPLENESIRLHEAENVEFRPGDEFQAKKVLVILGMTFTGPGHQMGAREFHALEPRSTVSGNDTVSMVTLKTTAFDAAVLQRRFARITAGWEGVRIDSEMMLL